MSYESRNSEEVRSLEKLTYKGWIMEGLLGLDFRFQNFLGIDKFLSIMVA